MCVLHSKGSSTLQDDAQVHLFLRLLVLLSCAELCRAWLCSNVLP